MSWHQFWTEYVALLHDWPHYAFELTFMLVFDVIIGLIIWPFIKKVIADRADKLHREMDAEHGITHNKFPESKKSVRERDDNRILRDSHADAYNESINYKGKHRRGK